MADASLIFDILGRDRVSDVLKRVKGEAAKANDENIRGLRAFEAQIEKTRATVTKLAVEYARVGTDDARRDYQRAVSQLKRLERFKADLGRAISVDPGATGSGGLVSGISQAIMGGVDAGISGAGRLAKRNPAIAAAIAGGILAGAPAIGAAVSAVVGGGIIAAGILLASSDPRVGAAWSAFANDGATQLKSAAGVFVDPLVRGTQVFGATLGRIMPDIRSMFDRMSPVLDRLFIGAAGFVEHLMPGLDALTRMADPVLTDIAAELPRIADAATVMFREIEEGAGGGAQALHDLITAVEVLAVTTGATIGTTEKLYAIERGTWGVIFAALTNNQTAWENSMRSVAEVVYGTAATTPVAEKAVAAFRNFSNGVSWTGSTSQLTAAQLQQLSGQISATTLTADVLAGKMTDRLMGTMLGLSHSTLGVQSSLLSLKDTFSQNGLAIDQHTGQVSMNTQAGISNRESVLSAVEANLRMYDAQISSGVSAADAAAKYATNTQALHDQLAAAGLTETQIGDLIGEYGRVPGKVNTAIATEGLATAITDLNELLRVMLGLPSYKKVTIDEVTVARRIDAGVSVGAGMRAQRWGGVTEYAATGLLREAAVYAAVGSGARYGFAEPATGGEAFVPKNGDYGRSMAILEHAASWYGATVTPEVASTGRGVAAETARGATRSGNLYVTNTYHVHDATDPKRVVSAIRQYEQDNGKRWRDI